MHMRRQDVRNAAERWVERHPFGFMAIMAAACWLAIVGALAVLVRGDCR